MCAFALFLSILFLCNLCSGQTILQSQPKAPATHSSHFGIGLKMSTLGAGIEGAARLTSHSNLRAGFNMFIYGRPFDTDGITYHGGFYLRSAQVNYDWFPFRGGFHLSPGMLVYDGNRMSANISVPGGHIFSINRSSFRSDPKDPIRGNATITFWKVAPALLIGWGNLIPRKSHRFSIPFEFGIVFHGQPNLAFSLTGKACDPKSHYCSGIAADPTGQSYIASERAQINSDISSFKFYPVVSGGFAVNF